MAKKKSKTVGVGKRQPSIELGRENAPWEGKGLEIPGYSPEAPQQKSPSFSEVGDNKAPVQWLLLRAGAQPTAEEAGRGWVLAAVVNSLPQAVALTVLQSQVQEGPQPLLVAT